MEPDPARTDIDAALAAAAVGDATAYPALHRAVAHRVLDRVRAVLRDEHQSEEVAQEVMLEVWETAHRFDPARGNGLGWVLTVARRRAVDRVRASQASRRRDHDHQARVDLSRPAPFDPTAAAAEATIDASHLHRALAALPDHQRRALELTYFGGHTQAEVARLTRAPLGTTKSRIRSGLAQLRVALEPLAA